MCDLELQIETTPEIDEYFEIVEREQLNKDDIITSNTNILDTGVFKEDKWEKLRYFLESVLCLIFVFELISNKYFIVTSLKELGVYKDEEMNEF